MQFTRPWFSMVRNTILHHEPTPAKTKVRIFIKCYRTSLLPKLPSKELRLAPFPTPHPPVSLIDMGLLHVNSDLICIDYPVIERTVTIGKQAGSIKRAHKQDIRIDQSTIQRNDYSILTRTFNESLSSINGLHFTTSLDILLDWYTLYAGYITQSVYFIT